MELSTDKMIERFTAIDENINRLKRIKDANHEQLDIFNILHETYLKQYVPFQNDTNHILKTVKEQYPDAREVINLGLPDEDTDYSNITRRFSITPGIDIHTEYQPYDVTILRDNKPGTINNVPSEFKTPFSASVESGYPVKDLGFLFKFDKHPANLNRVTFEGTPCVIRLYITDLKEDILIADEPVVSSDYISIDTAVIKQHPNKHYIKAVLSITTEEAASFKLNAFNFEYFNAESTSTYKTKPITLDSTGQLKIHPVGTNTDLIDIDINEKGNSFPLNQQDVTVDEVDKYNYRLIGSFDIDPKDITVTQTGNLFLYTYDKINSSPPDLSVYLKIKKPTVIPFYPPNILHINKLNGDYNRRVSSPGNIKLEPGLYKLTYITDIYTDPATITEIFSDSLRYTSFNDVELSLFSDALTYVPSHIFNRLHQKQIAPVFTTIKSGTSEKVSLPLLTTIHKNQMYNQKVYYNPGAGTPLLPLSNNSPDKIYNVTCRGTQPVFNDEIELTVTLRTDGDRVPTLKTLVGVIE